MDIKTMIENDIRLKNLERLARVTLETYHTSHRNEDLEFYSALCKSCLLLLETMNLTIDIKYALYDYIV